MSKLSEIGRRVGMLVRREKFARELEEEMRLHRELKEKELIADGADASEAQYAASRQFGNAMYLRERGREAWGWMWLEDFVQDLRFGARMLGKNPGFTIVAVVTLALGIGANTAIFSVVNAVLLRPLPYHDPAKLVRADAYWPRINDEVVPGPDYTNWKLNNHGFEALAAFDSGDQINLTSAGQPERIESVLVTANFLRVLGVQPSLGRDFRPEEAQPGAKLVAILSDGLWRRKFGAEPQILGKGITLNGQSYTVIGVMPEGFRFPDRRTNPEILLAFQLPTKVDWTARSVSLTRVIGRLKSDVSITQANTELATLSKRTEADIPATFLHMRDGMQVRTTGLYEKLVGDIRPTLLILLAAVAFVLLIGCLNVANLQLARFEPAKRTSGARGDRGGAYEVAEAIADRGGGVGRPRWAWGAADRGGRSAPAAQLCACKFSAGRAHRVGQVGAAVYVRHYVRDGAAVRSGSCPACFESGRQQRPERGKSAAVAWLQPKQTASGAGDVRVDAGCCAVGRFRIAYS